VAGRLEGKVALVTGAARGQGAAEALAFADEGAAVVLADVLDAEGRSVAQSLGPQAHYVHLDVREPTSWTRAVAEAERAFGPISVLVNNAAVLGTGGVEDATPEDFLNVVAVNQLGCFLGMQAAVRSMRRTPDGVVCSIVNVSSTGGMVGYPGAIAYAGSKWAVRGMTKAAALELAPDIRVNSLHPGPVDTPMIREEGVSDEEFASRWQAIVPLARPAQPGEIAQVALFLASDESSFMTGSEVVVDGGRTAGSRPPRVDQSSKREKA
jgi:3alpha(or 20beta)-hydroxysteroid dehydrogenase